MRFIKILAFNLLLIGLLIFVLAFVAGSFLNSYTRHGQYLTLPDLKGLPIEEVENILKQKKLRYQITDTVFIEGMPKLSVVEQNPNPNSKVKEGRIIYLSLNANSTATVLMPNLINGSLRYAETVINGMGLKLGDVTFKPDIAQNAVLDQLWNGQSIQPNTKIPKGAVISLVVGDGSGGAIVPMPDLSGLNLQDATNVLHASLLELGAVVYEGNVSDSSRAVITRQNPPFMQGSTIKSGETIDVFLAAQKQ